MEVPTFLHPPIHGTIASPGHLPTPALFDPVNPLPEPVPQGAGFVASGACAKLSREGVWA